MIDRENLAEAVYAAEKLGERLEGRAEGEALGVIKGRNEGRLEGFLVTARNMLKAGFDIRTIAECTNLPESEIRQLA